MRALLTRIAENGDLDKEVLVRVVRRRLEGGYATSIRLVPISRFGRMHFAAISGEKDNYIVIEQDDLDQAKEELL